ncbi:MAG: hypothetical protein LVQ97_01540 [Candidatus Micrarchaeales archaeon]|jgi:hypothetical protein|uniref:Uncharacterized protein n=1 Tax=Candidatus Micrarchaeum acidiphilum ARMAN-2 TaxID=425595 RepID=C7DI28_MICA2|nr:MAG: hypothetical protein UNLARM2_0720 [Candidatus Micrarchaeum acidiphilum ARMAN-2]MCW6160850.1 hypothetical protein [Candidatus Micrarchaeales archaeon]
MADEINFMDIMALSKITPSTTVEKFGGLVNSSFFDGSNMLGSLKLKGLVDFTSISPGQNAIKITDLGNKLLGDAKAKSTANFDQLDLAILNQMSAGRRGLNDLTASVNLRPLDMAMRLNKMLAQGYISVDFRNGKLDLSLTEKGFMQSKSGKIPEPPQEAKAELQQQAVPQPSATPQVQVQPMQPSTVAQNPAAVVQQQIPQSPPSQAQVPEKSQSSAPSMKPKPANSEESEIKELENMLVKVKKMRSKRVKVMVAILLIVVVVLILKEMGIISL